MSGVYELIDTETGNAAGFFDTKEQALAAVRQDIAENGLRAAATLGLAVVDNAGRVQVIAKGRKLVDLASPQQRRSA